MTIANDTTAVGAGVVVAPVGDLAALLFSGADAALFLQGQLTNDVAALPAGGGWQRSAYCSPKGRMLASCILCRRSAAAADGTAGAEEEYAMLLSADLADDAMKRLRMYLLRAKARIARAPAAFAFVAGARSVPEFSDADDVLTIAEGPGRALRCCLQGDAGRLSGPGEERSADAFAWRRAQIADAVPWVRAATRDLFIPQMVNYEAAPLCGVSFQKGCYVGQEVVARLYYRGTVKRRARPAVGEGPPPMPGATLRDAGGQAVGNVVDAAPQSAAEEAAGATPGEQFSALACAQLSAAELLLEDGREVRLLPAPHPLPDGRAQ